MSNYNRKTASLVTFTEDEQGFIEFNTIEPTKTKTTTDQGNETQLFDYPKTKRFEEWKKYADLIQQQLQYERKMNKDIMKLFDKGVNQNVDFIRNNNNSAIEIKEGLKKQQQELEHIHRKLDKATENNNDLQRANNTIAALQDELNKARSMLDSTRTVNDELVTKIHDAQEQLKKSVERNTIAANRIMVAERENTALKTRLTQMQQTVKTHTTNTEQLERQLKKINDDFKAQQQQLERATKTINDNVYINEANDAECRRLQEKINNDQLELQQTTQKLNRAIEENKTLQSKYDELEQESEKHIDELRKTNRDLNKRYHERNQTVYTFQARIQELMNSKKTNEETIVNLRHQLQVVQKEMDNNNNAFERDEETIQNLRTQLENLQKENQYVDAVHNSRLIIENRKLKENLKNRRQQIKQLKAARNVACAHPGYTQSEESSEDDSDDDNDSLEQLLNYKPFNNNNKRQRHD